MSESFFDPILLDRCRMSEEEAVVFKDESRQCIKLDEETNARIVYYVHPDGRVLIDKIRLPFGLSS